LIEAGPLELRLHGEQYEELKAALEEQGFEVQIEGPIERRDAGGVAVDVAIHLSQALEGAILGQFVQAVRDTLSRDRKRPVTVPIYGPRGKVLSRVEIAPQE
jgi:hypothetical protein